MRIYSMTATFGKLEHETLTLEPGLNVITAGNEWGKSTWCAFLAVMLYGLDTRAKSTKTALADKERYAPWSGSPMSGRIDLNWEGRDITIERRTKGRTLMGEFRAYETATGLAIPELDARNCGEVLLGVERSVFLRTGFIRFRDLSVTDDEALRRRLNSLVTTGDENSAADRLAGELKVLKNRVRHNRSGLLPQAEAERDRLDEKYRELKRLEAYNDEILQKLEANAQWHRELENHRAALIYKASLEDAEKVVQAQNTLRETWTRFQELSASCETLPDRNTALHKLEQLHAYQDELLTLQQQLQLLPRESVPEAMPEQFQGLTPEEAREKAREDCLRHDDLGRGTLWHMLLGVLLMLAGAAVFLLKQWPGLLCIPAGAALLIWGVIRKKSRKQAREELEAFYGSRNPADWEALAEKYAEMLTTHNRKVAAIRWERESLEGKLRANYRNILEITGEEGLDQSRKYWEHVAEAWEAREEALEDARKAKAHYEDLKAMARQGEPPEYPDRLEHSEIYTLRLLEECTQERTRLENHQGKCRGNMETLGSKAELEKALDAVNQRIRELERTYGALTVAMETLDQARQELQRRFAPGIARRAGELMQQMTGGRYDRLSIGQDLSLRAGAQKEDTLQDTLWRSDGTVDQLYLSLRLAVAEALLPGAPLVLDDALVRFDDDRLKAAMEILRRQAESGQVILFTCHSRESKLV